MIWLVNILCCVQANLEEEIAEEKVKLFPYSKDFGYFFLLFKRKLASLICSDNNKTILKNSTKRLTFSGNIF